MKKRPQPQRDTKDAKKSAKKKLLNSIGDYRGLIHQTRGGIARAGLDESSPYN
jgi:hypothetical protein